MKWLLFVGLLCLVLGVFLGAWMFPPKTVEVDRTQERIDSYLEVFITVLEDRGYTIVKRDVSEALVFDPALDYFLGLADRHNVTVFYMDWIEGKHINIPFLWYYFDDNTVVRYLVLRENE